MAGIRQLRKIELGKETTAGTAVTPTTVWRGLGALTDGRVVTFPEEFIGVIGGGDRSYIARIEATLSMDSTDATFEQLPHLLIAGVAASTTGSQDGTGSGYIYTYIIPYSAAPTIKTYTIRGGDNQQAEQMDYAFVESLSLSGNAGEAVMMNAEWRGRAVTNATFSTSATVPTVETILASSGLLYLDAASGTYGATVTTSTLISFGLDLSALNAAKWTMGGGDGNGEFDFVYAGNREITGTLQFEHNAAAVTEKTAFRDQTPRLMRLKFEGSALTTAGTSYSKKTFIIDLPIKYESFDALDDVDGNSVVTANFRSRYNATVGNAGKFIVVLNSTTSIP